MLIMVAPGKAHNNKLKRAMPGPPIFQPKMVMVCVVEGPGNKLQKAFTSMRVSWSKNLCLSTNLFLNWGMCICGPPNAERPNQKTLRRNLICLACVIFVKCC